MAGNSVVYHILENEVDTDAEKVPLAARRPDISRFQGRAAALLVAISCMLNVGFLTKELTTFNMKASEHRE